MKLAWCVGALIAGWVVIGCGGDSKRHVGAGGLRVNERGTVDHGYVPPDACAFFTNPGCTGEGVSCRDINGGGSVRSCTYWGFNRGTCDPGRPGDECCMTSDCSEGECLWADPVQGDKVCGEPVSEGHNVCVANECEADADCPGGICTSSSTFGVQQCMPAACTNDADCTARFGGACRHIYGGCCRVGEPGSGGCEVCEAELPGPFRSSAVACIYPDDGCRYDGDCPAGSQCTIVGGVAACRIECTANDF